MNAVDTNVIFYAYDGRDPDKQAIARQLLRETRDGVLLWQVACEYLNASRKLALQGYRVNDARLDLRDLEQTWSASMPAWDLLDIAAELSALSSISFWDAMIVAACQQAGVTVLYSEDLGGRPSLLGVTFINPFAKRG